MKPFAVSARDIFRHPAASIIMHSNRNNSFISNQNSNNSGTGNGAPAAPVAVAIPACWPMKPTDEVPAWVPPPWRPMPGHPHPFAALHLSIFPTMTPPPPLHMGKGPAHAPKVGDSPCASLHILTLTLPLTIQPYLSLPTIKVSAKGMWFLCYSSYSNRS